MLGENVFKKMICNIFKERIWKKCNIESCLHAAVVTLLEENVTMMSNISFKNEYKVKCETNPYVMYS